MTILTDSRRMKAPVTSLLKSIEYNFIVLSRACYMYIEHVCDLTLQQSAWSMCSNTQPALPFTTAKVGSEVMNTMH